MSHRINRNAMQSSGQPVRPKCKCAAGIRRPTNAATREHARDQRARAPGRNAPRRPRQTDTRVKRSPRARARSRNALERPHRRCGATMRRIAAAMRSTRRRIPKERKPPTTTTRRRHTTKNTHADQLIRPPLTTCVSSFSACAANANIGAKYYKFVAHARARSRRRRIPPHAHALCARAREFRGRMLAAVAVAVLMFPRTSHTGPGRLRITTHLLFLRVLCVRFVCCC